MSETYRERSDPMTKASKTKDLNVPYFSQRDNKLNPGGSCNVTCIAMALAYHGVVGDGQGRLPDQLYRYMENNGLDRQSPHDLAQLVNSRYGKSGIKDSLSLDGTIEDIKASINSNAPVVVHGWFTQSGHIILIKGYDDEANSFIVHDPWGEWFRTGYDRRPTQGANERYSYQMISKLCEDVGDPTSIWMHSVTKVAKVG